MLAEEEKDTVINNLIFRYDTETHTAALVGTDADITEIKFTNPIMEIEGVEYTVKTISYDAFVNNRELVRVIIPEGVDSIGKNAFAGCSTIRFIEFPSTISYFGQNAFGGCSSMDFVSVNSSNADLNLRNYLPNNQSMTLYVPEGRSGGYKDVNLENSWKTKFGDRIYEGRMEIKSFEINGLEMKFVCATNENSSNNKATLYTYDNDISFVEIPSKIYTYTVVGIGRPAFANKGLQRLKIDGELDYIHPNAFSGCRNLVYIGWNESDPNKYSPNIFPKNELMTLFVPTDCKYYYDQSEWKNEQFGDRIYEGEMKVRTYDGMEFLYADGPYEKNAVLIEGKDGKSVSVESFYLGNPNDYDNYDYSKQYNVKNIGRSAFAGKNVESLTISYGVTTISNQAFQSCSNLKTINLSSSLETIGTNAFNGCNSLIELSLPASIKKIGSGAFSGCNNLIRVESRIPSSVSIPDNLFVINNNIEKILYSPNLNSYQNIKGWKDGFTYFLQGYKTADKTFEYKDKDDNKICDITYACATSSSDAIIMSISNPDLLNLEVPAKFDGKNVIGVYKDAFKQAKSIEQLTFEDKDGASGLTIGRGALNDCTRLRFLKLPSRLAKLGSGAFSSCNSLAHILFRSNASILSSDVFNGNTRTNATIYIPTGSAPQDFVDRGWNINHIIEADLLEEFKDIKKCMTYIGWKQNAADKGTAKLTIGISGSVDEQFEIDNFATSNQGTTYDVIGIANNAFSNIGSFKTLKIADGIESIGASAFRNRPLTRIILPESLKTIEENAFNGCRSLVDIEPHDGKQLKYEVLGAGAFQNCTSLEKVTLPSTLQSIGLSAFAGCAKLTEIESKIKVPYDIDGTVFPNYSATLYVPYSTDEAYRMANGWKNFGEHISIGSRQEYSEKGLNYVYASEGTTATLIKSNPEEKNLVILDTIPGTKVVVSTIAESAFKDNRNIESIIISDSIKTIGAKAFENCTNIKKIVLSKSLTSIGDNAFGGLANLKTIISKVPAARLGNLCSSIINVFTSDDYQSITTSPEIYIPVGENSESIYKEKWSAFHEGKFVMGYPDYDVPSTKPIGWFFDILTTIDESKVDGDTSADVVYGIATLKKTIDRVEADGNLVIPSKVKIGERTYEITKIADNAFNEYPTKSEVKNLIIPDSVTEIGANAFRGFYNVQKVWLPKSLTYIGSKAFDGCNAITHVCSKMENPKSMSDDIFSIPTINTATLFVPSMSGYTTDSWTKFSNVVVGEYVKDVTDGNMTFACYQVKKSGEETAYDKYAILTKASTNIRTAAVKDSISSDELKFAVLSIGKYAFYDCKQLAKVELPKTLTSIGESAFGGCAAIREIISDIKDQLFPIEDEEPNSVFHADVKNYATLYVPIESKETYKATRGWKSFTHDNIIEGKWHKTTDADANHLKYRYHTGKKIATVVEVVFPTDENELIIPSTITIDKVTYDVDSIAISKFTNKDKVKKLVIHDAAEGMEGIKTIDANSFSGCTNLATVFLPSSLEKIGEKAFDACSNIANLNIQHSSAPDINANVFSISEGNKAALFVKKGTAGSYDKDGWNKFSNIVEGEFLDAYIGSVGDEKDITFTLYTTTDAEEHPVNAAIITKAATNTQLVTIPASITREGTEYLIKNIGSYAFSTSKNLNNLKIATNVETIGKSAFTSCTDLKTLELPSSLRAIKSDAFGGCKSLVEIVSNVDKDNLFAIDNDVFHSDTKAHAKLYVPEGESKGAYEGTDYWSSFEHANIIDGHWKQTSTPDNYYLKYKYLKSSRDAEVIEIDFPDEENVTKLEIPSSVEIEGVKYYVNKIVPADFTHKDKVQTLIIQNKNWDEDEIAGKNGIELISANTFQGCTNLQKIWLPKSLKSIGSKAFDGCNPTRICIEALPTIEKSDAFSGSAYNNALLFVPTGSLATIDNQARWRDFSWKYEGYYEDESTEGLDRTYIYLKQADDSRTAILTKSKKSETIDTSISLGENTYRVTIIGKNAFSGVDLGEWTSLPEGIVAIEKDAFRSTKLKEIKLPSTLKSIGDNAFRYNDLTSISIPNGVTIGQYAFANCKLSEVTLPNDLTKIEKGAFRENTNIMSLTIPESVNTIGDEALMGCTGLTKIVLPSSLTAIASNAFDGCSNLTEVISKLENTNAIDGISLSVPTAILYVKEGTIDHYSNWSCLYVLEGDRLIGAADGLEYAYTSSEKSGNNAILIGVTEGAINENGLVIIPDSVTIDNLKYKVVAIGKDVFKDNTNLKKLEIRANLSSIGVNAFEGCSNLAEVICDEYDEKLNVLSQLDPLLYVPSDEIKKKYVNAGWKSDRVYVGERQEKELGGLVYAYTIADAESSIREAVLVGATAEAISENGAVTIPGSIKFKVDEKDEAETEFNVISIVNSVFSGNTKVKLLTIGEHVKSIGEHAFDGCTNLKEVVSKITDENVIGSISFSQPGVVLYVPEAALVDAYKAWNFTYTLVGERKAWNKDGLYYLCATGDKKAILVEGKAVEMRGDELAITGSIAFKVDEKDEAETTFDVIAIADEAFKGNTDIKNLKIEENIETIGASVFQGCLGVNKIWLPASLARLKDMAFYGCSNMAYIGNASAAPLATVGANVFPKTTLTLYVPFGSKEAYTESSVWGALSKVKEGTFVEAVNLNGLTFECIVNDKNEKVTQLVKAASSLTEVIIPSEVQNGDATYRVTSIEDRAFEACTKLTVITSKISKENLFEFKKNVFPEAIYENATVYAPYDTDGSTEKKYKETEGWKYFATYAKGEKKAETVGDLTYEYIVGVRTATITKAATNISKVSIDGTVTIDGAAYTVKAIGANAFKGCNGLKVVWLPATLESIDKTAFSGCNNIAYVSSAIDNPTAADANIFPSSATLFVPQGRKSNYNIGGWNNFAYVGEGRFVDAATASDMSFDCYTDNAGQKKAILKKYNVNAATVEIPGSVKVGNDTYTVSIITKQAFASKTYMESLIIPSGVETIEAETFSACSKLKWIESKIVNPISISNVFANTNATLFIPSNNVSDYKAKGWNFLNVFVGERKQTDVDGWTYVYSTGDKKAVLTRVGNVGTNVTINGTFKIGKDEYTVTSVGDAVFKGKSNIEALTIAKSIENIGANAFEGCVKLVSITCEGSSPAKLGADAFPSANVTVNVPNDAVNTYKNHPDWKPFANNILGITTSVEDDPTGAYNIIVPAGGDATPEVEIWNGLDASGDVVIPEVVELNGSDYKVTGIAANAYDSNTDLTSIVIPSSITSIGASAFAGCTNLKSITVYCVTPINLSAVAATRRALTRAGGSSSVFEGVNKETCILYVPAESIDAYKQAEGWKDFKKIYAIGTNAINGIVVSEGKPFDVYNLQGRKVKAHTTTFSGLPAGVYIVNGKKVMVK